MSPESGPQDTTRGAIPTATVATNGGAQPARIRHLAIQSTTPPSAFVNRASARLTFLLILILSSSLLPGRPAFGNGGAIPFSFTTFDIPGAIDMNVYGVNNATQIVGLFQDTKNMTHGFLRGAGGIITAVNVPGATETLVGGINNRGQIVGYFTEERPNIPRGVRGHYRTHAFLRASTGAITTFDVTGDESRLYPSAINDTGQIVGVILKIGAPAHGFLRTAAGAATMIDAPAAANTYVQGVNNAGLIVGYFRNLRLGDTGFLRSSGGAITPIDISGASHTFALSINNAKEVVGYFVDANKKAHGFMLSATGAITIINVPGATNTYATSINDAGQIVGDFQRVSERRHGFVATPAR